MMGTLDWNDSDHVFHSVGKEQDAILAAAKPEPARRHRWNRVGRRRLGMSRCARCGAVRRGSGKRLQFILPFRKRADGLPCGWTPPAPITPPCVVL